MPDQALVKQINQLVDRRVAEILKNSGVIIPRAAGTVSALSTATTAPLAALSEQTQQVQPTTSAQYRETRVIEGFHLVATEPPTEVIKITNRFARMGEANISRGISDGVYQEMKGEHEIGLNTYLGNGDARTIYIYYDNGPKTSTSYPRNKLLCGKVIIRDGSLAIRDDRSLDTLDGYIVNWDDPFFDNTTTMDDDTKAAFGNMLQTLLAENIYGTITLNDALKVLSADGSTSLTGGGLTIRDSYANIMAKFTKKGVFFYDTSGRLLATFGPDGNNVSCLDILNEKTLAIRDNNEITRVLLGLLQEVSNKQTWGFELYDERGKTFMSTTRNRSWFAGANITARLLAVPLWSLIFASCGGAYYPDQNDLNLTPVDSYQEQTLSIPVASGLSRSKVFDGDHVWIPAPRTSPKFVLVKINVTNINDYTEIPLPDNAYTIAGGYFLVYAKGHVWIFYTNVTNTERAILAINIYDDTVTKAISWTTELTTEHPELDFPIFDGQYLYACSDNAGARPSRIHKFRFDEGPALTEIARYDVSGSEDVKLHTFDGTYLYGKGQSNIYKIDPVSMSTVTSVAHANSAYLATGITYDGKYLWVGEAKTAPTLSQVHKYDTDLTLIGSIDLSSGGTIVKPTFDGRHILVIPTTGQLDYIDIVQDILLGTQDIPNINGNYTTFDGLNLWGASAGNPMTVFRIPLL